MTTQTSRLSSLPLLVFLSCLLDVTKSIDLELVKVSCDRSLPIHVYDNDIMMTCNGDSKCTFGEEASIYGTCKC